MSSLIKVTPVVGGQEDGGVCSILEIGGCRLLLDCGASGNKVSTLYDNVDGIDAILISHADIEHIGALPYINGCKRLKGIPVVCTVPVHKFGQLLLYDQCLNYNMEGKDPTNTLIPTGFDTNGLYDLDDIDLAFTSVYPVRYSQNISLGDVCNGHHKQVSICAFASGRTIGGAMWKIRHGATEVLYVMDVNLKKEIVLDGANIDILPSIPALMITDSTCTKPGITVKKSKKDQSVSDPNSKNNQLVTAVMDGLRSENKGNILIPCETAGRALELIQMLGKCWLENNLLMDNLIFLSHMGQNVIDFAKSQLEWMSESLTKSFFNGKRNPFDIPALKVCTSVKDVERIGGTKVVIATVNDVSAGLSKELLLLWGGDPRCKIIFTDLLDASSLAAELKQKATTLPVLATITRPTRQDLEGEELANHLKEIERIKRIKEETELRVKREKELSLLIEQRNQNEDLLLDELDINDIAVADESKMDLDHTGDGNDPVAQLKRKRNINSSNKLSKFTEPSFPMFTNKETIHTKDDYGCSLHDLKFVAEINTTSALVKKNMMTSTGKNIPSTTNVKSKSERKDTQEAEQVVQLVSQSASVPWKIVPVKIRTQFTLGFKDLTSFLHGRADVKAIRALLTKLMPSNLIVLRGSSKECGELVTHANNIGIGNTYAPTNGETVSFTVQAGRVRLIVPPSTLSSGQRTIAGTVPGVVGGNTGDTVCNVCMVKGVVIEDSQAASEGVRVVRLMQSNTTATSEVQDNVNEAEGDAEIDPNAEPVAPEDEEVVDEVVEDKDDLSKVAATLEYDPDSFIGMVSVGEVTFDRIIKTMKKQYNTPVEFKDGMLILAGQVIVKKENENDFIVEGPPVAAYYQVRKALYQQFSYI